VWQDWRAGDWRRGSALPSHGRGHWFDPSIAHKALSATGPTTVETTVSAFRKPDLRDTCLRARHHCGKGHLG